MKYAINGDIKIAKTLQYDVVIVGSGIAGLYTALNIDSNLSCFVLAKDSMDISNSWLAQGGIAAALHKDDCPEYHLKDTVTAGAGLCNTEAVNILVNEAPINIKNLSSFNVPFDLDEHGELHFTREGGHSKHRVVHAGGDATGRETINTLSHIAFQRENISYRGQTCLYDIITEQDHVSGIVVRFDDSEFHFIKAKYVVIATGGIGQLFRSSTNPAIATGDGIAAAKRAGAKLANLEFIQFHPTGLWDETHKICDFLISEAVRGEGGILINSAGERFMPKVHELAELAPRDIVARGILSELKRSGESHVFIDITSKSEDFLKARFPTIFKECLSRGINISRDRIPVCPVQHYLMGGIETDFYGRTSIRGLYACGEAAHTGVHGANRLASNSILECLVFGRRVAMSINSEESKIKKDECETPPKKKETQKDECCQGATPPKVIANPEFSDLPSRSRNEKFDFSAMRVEVQNLMSDYCGVVRTKQGLAFALDEVKAIRVKLESVFDNCVEYLETLNIATVANAVLESALNRDKSVGSHFIE